MKLSLHHLHLLHLSLIYFLSERSRRRNLFSKTHTSEASTCFLSVVFPVVPGVHELHSSFGIPVATSWRYGQVGEDFQLVLSLTLFRWFQIIHIVAANNSTSFFCIINHDHSSLKSKNCTELLKPHNSSLSHTESSSGHCHRACKEFSVEVKYQS